MRARSALVFPIYLLAAFALLTSPALADQVFDLYAGQHILVGHVTVSDDDGQVNVSYAIDDA
ncbi:MAG: hypothetical protein KC620_22420, partial [Myxococcales bacterium]|nr:hypothetical protein [Myxococcales bacterium]